MAELRRQLCASTVEAWSPLLLVSSSEGSEALARKNGLSVADLLRPFATLNGTSVPFRSSTRSVNITELRARVLPVPELAFVPLETVEAHVARAVSAVPAGGNQFGYADTSIETPEDATRALAQSTGQTGDAAPWLSTYRRELSRGLRCLPQVRLGRLRSFIVHCRAHILCCRRCATPLWRCSSSWRRLTCGPSLPSTSSRPRPHSRDPSRCAPAPDPGVARRRVLMCLPRPCLPPVTFPNHSFPPCPNRRTTLTRTCSATSSCCTTQAHRRQASTPSPCCARWVEEDAPLWAALLLAPRRSFPPPPSSPGADVLPALLLPPAPHQLERRRRCGGRHPAAGHLGRTRFRATLPPRRPRGRPAARGPRGGPALGGGRAGAAGLLPLRGRPPRPERDALPSAGCRRVTRG